MPHRKQQFINGDIYHIMLRGIDDSLIFKDIDDYYRGIFSIYEFNNTKAVSIKERRRIRSRMKKLARGRASGDFNNAEEDKREKIVGILAFCFMPNHIHLLLKQEKNNGITKFMSKVGTGYAGYFNRKYKRKGYVFQNRFKDVYIKDDNQLRTVFAYIHTNPISLIEPKWKERGIKRPKEVIDFLENYKWFSYQDYIGKQNFYFVTERNFLSEFIGGAEECKAAIKNWVLNNKKIEKSSELFLE